MRDLMKAIPDVETLLDLQPEELGAKLLFLLRERIARSSQKMVILTNTLNEFNGARSSGEMTYPEAKFEQVMVALTEAWAWLEAQGLLIPAYSQVASAPWRILSRRAASFETEAELKSFASTRMLPRDALHPAIAKSVWPAFLRGEFAAAVFQAMREVEIAVRDAAGFDKGDYGSNMISKAFNKDTGPLRKAEDEDAERQALFFLFMGAYGRYRNPHSHRQIELTDPVEAMEIIMLANHLMRIVDERHAARLASTPKS